MRMLTRRPPIRRINLTFAALLLSFFALPAQSAEFPVKKQTIPDIKAMFGQVESRDVAPARTRIGGTIVSRKVDEGAQVKAGDVIATVADQKLALQAQSLDGQLDALPSQLDNANVAFKRAPICCRAASPPRRPSTRPRPMSTC